MATGILTRRFREKFGYRLMYGLPTWATLVLWQPQAQRRLDRALRDMNS